MDEVSVVLVGSMSQRGFFQLDIIDMQHVSKQSSNEIRFCSDCTYIRSYHLEKNGSIQHLLRAAKMVAGKPHSLVYGLDFKSGASTTLTDADLVFAKTTGASGGNFNGDEVKSLVAYDNRGFYHGGLKVDLGWSFPDTYHPQDGERFIQSVNNSQIRIITPHKLIKVDENGGRQLTHFAFDKQTKKWTSFTLAHSGWLRAFGHWVATHEAYSGFQGSLNGENSKENSKAVATGLYRSALSRFKRWDTRKTGVLNLINPIKNIFITMDTGKPDSEIILVDHNQLIYRVEDQIYAADIKGDKVINQTLLFKHQMAPAMHWAFIGSQ